MNVGCIYKKQVAAAKFARYDLKATNGAFCSLYVGGTELLWAGEQIDKEEEASKITTRGRINARRFTRVCAPLVTTWRFIVWNQRMSFLTRIEKN